MKAIPYILFCFLSLSVNKSGDFSFTDDCGNTIVIDQKAVLPAIIDNQFLKENLSSTYFEKCDANNEQKFKYHITSFIKKSKLRYELIVTSQAISSDTETILKYGFGYIHYNMKLKKVKGIITIQSVEYLYSEL